MGAYKSKIMYLIEMLLIGRIGSDAKLKHINGQTVLNWNMAYVNKWQNPDGQLMEKTIWVSCSLWDRPEMEPYLKKGCIIYVNGVPDAHIFTDKEGNEKAQLKLKVARVRKVWDGETETNFNH